MDTNQVETEVADSEPERRDGPWKLILIVIIITVIGVWLVPGDPQPEEPASEASEPPSLLDLPATAAGGAPRLPAAFDEPRIDNRPGARARALIAQMRSSSEIELDAIFNAAEQAQSDGELADAYLLYFFAAREGFTPAAMALATQADPASRDADSSVFDAADLTQAHKWYQLAAEQGDAEAGKRLAELRARVEQMAAAGDSQAQRIALQWQ
jgi:TPR repeat protein